MTSAEGEEADGFRGDLGLGQGRVCPRTPRLLFRAPGRMVRPPGTGARTRAGLGMAAVVRSSIWDMAVSGFPTFLGPEPFLHKGSQTACCGKHSQPAPFADSGLVPTS